MNPSTQNRLCVCYIHGLDRRRINSEDTPYLASLLAREDHALVDTFPSNELVSTVFTGVYPNEHGLWQATLRTTNPRNLWDRLVDATPDALTTTAQLFRYQFDRSFELPVIPPRRRRRLDFHRFKYYRWADGGDSIQNIGGFTTLFKIMGDRCRFTFAKDLTGTEQALLNAPSADKQVDFIQTYGLDQVEHWGLDQPEQVTEAMRRIDTWLKDAAQRCADQNVAMLIFSDHGQEAVKGYVDIKNKLKQWGATDRDCTYLIEAQCARFWFHDDQLRQRIVPKLEALDHTRAVRNKDLEAFGLHFTDESYGELYLYTDQGHTFFPHDFYHPLANAVMGWTERQVMGNRRKDPRHRGYHGHLPPHPAEVGFLVMTDPASAQRTTDRATLIDIAPTILTLTGHQPADTMKGRHVFEPATA